MYEFVQMSIIIVTIPLLICLSAYVDYLEEQEENSSKLD